MLEDVRWSHRNGLCVPEVHRDVLLQPADGQVGHTRPQDATDQPPGPQVRVLKQEGTLLKQEKTLLTQEGALLKQEGTLLKQEGARLKQEGRLLKQEGRLLKQEGRLLK